jgi:sulfoxide reductase heme-binding subunit YedZ
VLRVTPAQKINSALRVFPAWPLYPLGLMPAAWLWYLGLTGGLGPEPITALERELGKIGLQFVIAGLLVSPIRKFTDVNLVRYRRAIGLLAFYYILLHLMVWLFLDIGDLARIWADIVKRPYVTIGFAGFLALLPLAVTSNDWAVRKLGPLRWRSLHRLAYPAAVLGVVHYMWLVKSWPLEPILYCLAVAGLLMLRFWTQRRRTAA